MTTSADKSFYKVIVVGGGLAGLISTIVAAQKGASVLLLEAEDFNEARNTRPIFKFLNAIDPVRQGEQGISDSPEFFYKQTLKSGEYRGIPELVKTMCYRSYDSKLWLENLGIKFRKKIQYFPGGNYPRASVPENPMTVRESLISAAISSKAEILTRAFFEKLEKTPNGEFTVHFRDHGNHTHFLTVPKVILACGGFASNDRLCQKHDYRVSGLPSISSPKNIGIGIREGIRIGAGFVGMDFIDYSFGVRTKEKFVELLIPPLHYILVDENGNRVINELDEKSTREFLLSSPTKRLNMIFDPNLASALTGHLKDKLNWLREQNQITEIFLLRKENQTNFEKNLLHNILTHNKACLKGNQDQFGKICGNPLPSQKVACLPITLAKAATLGGLLINEKANVISRTGEPIKGLYAAGSIVGGIHGTHMVAGNGSLASIVFGRLAGEDASL